MMTNGLTEVSMSQPTPVSLRPHHGYKSWSTDWYDDQGHRRTKRFGKEGEVSRATARGLFNRWMKNEWEAKPFVRNPDDPTLFTVRMLAEGYKAVAKTLFVKNGKPTSHVHQVNAGMDALRDMFGDNPAAALSNPRVAKLRDAMIFDAAGDARAVKTVNGRLHCIKAACKWARERDLISAEVLADVLAVQPLRIGRCEAKAPREVKPVEWDVVERTKAKLPPTVCDMIDVQWLTGMRPGEVCSMRGMEIDSRGDMPIYSPSSHKLEHKNKKRRIPLGPQAWAIVKLRIGRGYLFSPATAQGERLATKAENRKTPLSCGNVPGSNRKSRPAVAPGACYTTNSYRKAIRHACRAVEKEMQKTDPKAKFPAWHPNQIRHSWATRTRDEFGIEAASDGLGHNVPATTAIYAERSLKRAKEVAKAVG
jgi:integrase